MRSPGQRATDGDAACTAAMTREVLRRCVMLVHEILTTGDEVEDCVQLGALLTIEVPVLAVLAAAANMRDCQHIATLQPRQRRGGEGGFNRPTVAAIAGENRRMAAGELAPFLGQD